MLKHSKRRRNLSNTLSQFITLTLLAAFFITLNPIGANAAVQATYYVSPTGNDSNPGTLAQPFATITKARDTIRAINGNMTGDIYVYILQGNYYIDKTIEFTQADSGTNGYNIYYKNYNSIGSARFIGGQIITGWSLDSGNVYKVNLGTGTNLASGRTVSALSNETGNAPGNAADGNGATRWAASSASMPQWWEVDLGSVQTINSTEIDFYDPSNRYYGYKIEVSTDNSTYKLVVDKSSNDAKATTLKDYFDPVDARYVKITVTRTSEVGGFASFYEARVYNRFVFNTLYENGKRAIKARYPDYEFDSQYPMAQAPYLYSEGVTGSNTVLQYKSGDLNPSGWGLNDAQVYIWPGQSYNWAWFTDTVPIKSIDTVNRQLTLLQQTRYQVGTNSRYYIQGIRALLNQPGEFHLDTSTGYLYYYARDGAISNQEIIAPKVRKIISITGASEGSRAHNIIFDGLTFECTEFTDWYRHGWVNEGDSLEGHTYNEYDRQITMTQHRTGAVFLQNTDNIAIINSHFKNIGYSAIYMLFYNQYNTVYGNWIEHIGNSGVILEGRYPGEGDVCKYNTISNNLIHNIGELLGNPSGVYIMNAGNNEVSYSEIFNSPRYAVVWNAYPDLPYGTVYCKDNMIKYLKVYDCLQDSGDTGALYSYGLTDDTPYYSNTVQQVTIDGCFAHPSMLDCAPNGIFMDNDANGQTFTNVKISNTQGALFRNNDSGSNITTNVNWTGTFNEGLIDYTNIGLKDDFQYPRPMREESFENGLSVFSTGKGTASVSSAQKHSGTYSYVINQDTDVIYQKSGPKYNKVAELWFYDNGSSSLQCMARVDDGEWNNSYTWRGLGVDTSVSGSNYVYRVGISDTVSNVARTTGWHQFVWDYTSGYKVDMYIDGTLVASPTGTSAFSLIAMGDWWDSMYTGESYFDDFTIQDP